MTTALLVVDMQQVFLPTATSSLPNVLKLCSHFSCKSLPIIFTQHGHVKEELKPPYKNQLVRKWGPDGSIKTGTKDWELIPQIEQAAKQGPYPILAKNSYDAFVNTDLEQMLKEREVERVVVCGVLTDCCCDTTTKSAFNRGFESRLVGDACGTASRKSHDASLKVFENYYEEVVSTKDVLQELA